MIRNLIFVALVLLVYQPLAAEEPQAAPDESADMRRLFNGRDLTGWDGDPRLWSVRDGVIHGETTAEKPAQGNTFLIWQDGKTRDFELRLSFRCSTSNNSGIQYRSQRVPQGKAQNPFWRVRGYQHEIRNASRLPDVAGFIYDEGGKRRRICLVGEQATWENGQKNVTGSLIDTQDFQELFKRDDWNDVVIVAQENHLQHYLNNRLILDFKDNDPKLTLRDGILAFQLHQGKPMWVEFKDIRMKEIE